LIELGEQPTTTDVIVGVCGVVPPPPLPPPQAVRKKQIKTARIVERFNITAGMLLAVGWQSGMRPSPNGSIVGFACDCKHTAM
jgi:hypothetical protein